MGQNNRLGDKNRAPTYLPKKLENRHEKGGGMWHNVAFHIGLGWIATGGVFRLSKTVNLGRLQRRWCSIFQLFRMNYYLVRESDSSFQNWRRFSTAT
jgi:hypothetical protein